MKTLAAFALLTLVCGCSHAATKHANFPAGTLTSDSVHDDDPHRDFIKVWHYQVTPEVQMNVRTILTPWLEKCNQWGCSLAFDDELKQGDGKFVSFDCKAVADKIVDRDLVAKVETACEAIHATATDYWMHNGDPSEFEDSEGRTWKRSSK